MAGWLLQFDGSPYTFGTRGVTSVASWDSADDEPVGAVLLSGWLAHPDFEIQELMHPVDGALDWSGPAFRLFDLPAPSGPAAGYRVVTWLATRDLPTQITQTVLSASLNSGDTTVCVADAGLFPASGTVWIDQEAIDYASRTATTLNGCTRGVLGSRAVEHPIDADSSYAPVVYAEFPGLAERRAVWWRVDDAGAATRVYAGYCRDTPSLDEDGLRFVVQTVSAWERHREAQLGNPSAVTKLRGYNLGSVGIEVTHADLGRTQGVSAARTATALTAIRDTADDALAAAADAYRQWAATMGFSANVTVAVVRRGAGFQLTVTTNGFANATGDVIAAILRIGQQAAVDSFRPTGSDPKRATAILPYAPPVVLMYGNGAAGTIVPVTSTLDLPTTWTATPYTADAPFTTTVAPVLRGTYGDEPVTIAPESTDATTRTLTATVTVGRLPGPGEPPRGLAPSIEEPVALRLATRVRSDHWVYALRRGVVEDTSYLKSQIDPRDWNWDLANQLAGVTTSATAAVDWYVDGGPRLRDLVLPMLSMSGAGLGVRGGKIAPIPFRFAVDSDGYDAVVTSTDLIAGEKPTWTVLRDGIVTGVEVSQGGDTLIVNDRVAAARYGTGRPPVKVELQGVSLLATQNPRDIAAYVLSRLLGLWRDPVAAVTLPVTWSFGTAVSAGSFVAIDEWLLPSGSAERGIGSAAALALLGTADQRGFVYGRTLRPGSASVLLHCLILPRAVGWSPCARVQSYDNATKTLTLATGYVGGTATDYAGSNLAAYRYASTAANDGGTSWFAAGYKVRLIVRDNTTRIVEDREVASVTPGSRAVALTAALSAGMQARISGGEMVDLQFSDYSIGGFTDTQKTFAAVANNATLDIGGTGDAAKRFAP